MCGIVGLYLKDEQQNGESRHPGSRSQRQLTHDLAHRGLRHRRGDHHRSADVNALGQVVESSDRAVVGGRHVGPGAGTVNPTQEISKCLNCIGSA